MSLCTCTHPVECVCVHEGHKSKPIVGECRICPGVSKCGPRGQLKMTTSLQGAEEDGLLSAPGPSSHHRGLLAWYPGPALHLPHRKDLQLASGLNKKKWGLRSRGTNSCL